MYLFVNKYSELCHIRRSKSMDKNLILTLNCNFAFFHGFRNKIEVCVVEVFRDESIKLKQMVSCKAKMAKKSQLVNYDDAYYDGADSIEFDL